MGTDIHAVMEIEKDGKWEQDLTGVVPEYRNYNLFAIMADVRNGYGFAGCVTGKAVEPISKPKGLPDGYDDEECYGHSASYLSGKEIADYIDKNKTTLKTHQGIMSIETYIQWKQSDDVEPNSYCGGITGVEVVDEDNLSEILKGLGYNLLDVLNDQKNVDIKASREIYVKATWTTNLFYTTPELIEMLNDMKVKSDDLERVRVVFWFDS